MKFTIEIPDDVLADALAPKLDALLAANGGLKPRLLDVKQAAAYLGRTEVAFRHLITKGGIPTTRLPDTRRLFFDIRDLDRVIDRSKTVHV